jgi:hypothetical protein
MAFWLNSSGKESWSPVRADCDFRRHGAGVAWPIDPCRLSLVRRLPVGSVRALNFVELLPTGVVARFADTASAS